MNQKTPSTQKLRNTIRKKKNKKVASSNLYSLLQNRSFHHQGSSFVHLITGVCDTHTHTDHGSQTETKKDKIQVEGFPFLWLPTWRIIPVTVSG